jgi:hypothetical protein
MPLSTYTSNDANFPSHESHDMIPRSFMTSEMVATLAATMLDCKRIATDKDNVGRKYIGWVNILYRHK